MDLLAVVMGAGDDEVSRLIRQHQDAMRRAMIEGWCRKVVHGNEPCDCPGEVCIGIVLFG